MMMANETQGARSVRARDISQSIVQTGDGNVATLETTRLPDPSSVDMVMVLAELRTMLAGLGGGERGKIGRALDDAAEEAAKANPDKAEIAGTLTRALGYAKEAADFSEHVEKIKPLVVAAAGWIGAAGGFAAPLLAAFGLCAG
jgi:hypothetical protein